MYRVELERSAEKELNALPAHVFSRVIEVLRNLSNEPRPPGCRKLVGSVNDWRVRVGDYRVVYETDDAERVVRVMRVRLRSRAYR